MKNIVAAVMTVLLPLALCAQTTAVPTQPGTKAQARRQLRELNEQIRHQISAHMRQAATQELLDFLKSPQAQQTDKLRKHVRRLVAQGADVNGQDKDGNRVFTLALRTGDAETVKFLVRQGIQFTNLACPSAGGDYLTALAQKSVCVKGKALREPLQFENDVELAKFFRGRSEFAAQPSMKALAEAVDADNKPLAKYYIDWFGVNITQKGDKRTALHELASRDNIMGVVFLLEQGANPVAKDINGKTPADLTKSAKVRQITKYLGGEWNEKFPLHRAIRKGDMEKAMSLIYAGADVNEGLSSDGRTPLIEAARFNQKDMALLLISKGADLNKGAANGFSPLHFTVLQGKLSMVKLLVEKGADVNVVDAEGNTPLHYAVKFGRGGVAQYLKKHGARVDIKNKEGLSVAQIESQDAMERNQAYAQQVKLNLHYQ